MQLRLRRHVRGLAWTGIDQVLSAISNVVVSLAVARSAGADALGVFTVAFAAYLIALSMVRALVSEPMLTIPTKGTRGSTRAERMSASVAATFSVAASCAMLVIGWCCGGGEILLVGAVLPLLIMQDFARYAFFRRGRPELAALIDAVWVVASVVGWPIVASQGSPFAGLLVWAVGGTLGLLVGAAVGRTVPSSARLSLGWWWSTIRPLGGFLALDNLAFTVVSQITTLGLAAILGTADLGRLRGAQIIIGPVGLVLAAFNVFMLPRLSSAGVHPHTRIAVRASLGAAALAGLSTIALWMAAPFFVPLLYRDQVDVPAVLVLAVGTRLTLGALSMGPALVLKASQFGAPIMAGRVAAGVIGVPVVLFVASRYGLIPAAWAGNLGVGINLLVLTLFLRAGVSTGSKDLASDETPPSPN